MPLYYMEKGSARVVDDRNGRAHIVAVHLKETVPGKYREIPLERVM